MRSDVYKLSKDTTDFDVIPADAEKVAVYNRLDKKQALRLRLLAEELIGMLPELMEYCSAEFWIENSGTDFELHVSMKPDNILNVDRDKVLSVSKTGQNAAAVGIMNKIRIAAEVMIINYANASSAVPYEFYDMGMMNESAYYANEWSLMNYREQAKKDKPEWDELEKSIIANLADDVIVGMIGGKVDIIVKKSF